MTRQAAPAAPWPFVRAMPVLECADMTRSLAFYEDKLGFGTRVWGEPPSFAMVQRGTVLLALALAERRAPVVKRSTWAAYIYVQDVDRLHAELIGHRVAIAEPPEDRFYGCREFAVDDPDGNILAFGQVIEPDPPGPGLCMNVGRDASQSERGS